MKFVRFKKIWKIKVMFVWAENVWIDGPWAFYLKEWTITIRSIVLLCVHVSWALSKKRPTSTAYRPSLPSELGGYCGGQDSPGRDGVGEIADFIEGGRGLILSIPTHNNYLTMLTWYNFYISLRLLKKIKNLNSNSWLGLEL